MVKSVMAANNGWVSTTPETLATLPESVQHSVHERQARRGDLLALVTVQIYEHDEEPYVTFPQGAQLGPESDSSAIADVVRPSSGESDSLAIMQGQLRFV
jgi:hypothetical protein